MVFAMLLFIGGMYRVSTENGLNEVIRSDGRGYYAYLPALFIYQDNQFDSSTAKEKAYYPDASDQLYLFKDRQGKSYNKYFPGVALLQLPFLAWPV